MLPFGVAAGFAQIALPFLLRRIGLSYGDIGKYGALCIVPSAYQFLWAPIVDLGPRRKHWLVLLACAGALCLGTALLVDPRTHLALFIDLVVACEVFTGLTGSCLGGLMATTLPDSLRGRASGWSNAGNLGGAALGGGAIMWLMGHASHVAVVVASVLLVALPSFVAFFIEEAPRVARSAKETFGGLFRSVGRTLRSRRGFTGVLICISPVGTAALLNLGSSLGPDYGVSDDRVTFILGFLGGLITASGALLGGYLCDHMPRRVAYLGGGALIAIAGITMSLFPLTPRTFEYGISAYLFVAGLCYAAFSAMVLEIIGQADESASTQYTLFTAASNQAIAYTTYLDGWGGGRWGARGLVRTDAFANIVGIVFLGCVMLVFFRKRAQQQPPPPSREGHDAQRRP